MVKDADELPDGGDAQGGACGKGRVCPCPLPSLPHLPAPPRGSSLYPALWGFLGKDHHTGTINQSLTPFPAPSTLSGVGD